MPEPHPAQLVQPVVVDMARNFIRDMDVATMLVDETRSLVQAPVTDALRSRGGDASVGVLATLFDVGASDPALVACRPDWTATQNLSLHTAGGLDEGPIVVDSRLVRVGKKVVVVAADIYDAHGIDTFEAFMAAVDRPGTANARRRPSLAARGLLAFARLPRSAAAHADEYDPGRMVGQVRHHPSENPGSGPLHRRLGLELIDASTGRLQLDLTPYVANAIGTINGGAQAVMAEAAAEAMRPGLVAADLQVHYLDQLKAGPACTSGRIVRDAGDHSVVSVELVDAGNGDKLGTLATVTVRRRRRR
jgi:acyl-coenzyme A thioesterase PaaI-like protein